ncbi:MAG: hypothetical protein MI723_09075 [Caulobacterales bacterium]|nr:hypothetical protein [Caulobacterales bacterium]
MGAGGDASWWATINALAAAHPLVTLVLVLAGLYMAREAVGVLIDSVFVQAARILEDFASETRKLAASMQDEARATLVQMQREEFANEMASRQKELMAVLDRFTALDEKYKPVIKALGKAGERGPGKASNRALMTLAAEIAAADDRFSKHIDYVKSNEKILQAVHGEAVYTFSPFIRFFFASLFIPLIMLGGVLNFFLIKRPLDTLFAESGYAFAGSATLSEVSAATIIVMEAVIGFFFLESMRITKVLPNFHELLPRTRAVWASAFFAILVSFSVIEGSLAIWREELIALDAAVETGELIDFGGAPMLFQVILGVLMPFLLALIGIPLETFLKNARVVVLFLAAAGLSLIALPLAVGSVAINFTGEVIAATFNVATSVPNAIAGLAMRAWRSVRASRGRPA